MLQTYEIGSLPKPWLVLPQDSKGLNYWAERIEFEEKEEFQALMEKGKLRNGEEQQRLRELGTIFNLRFLESTGLDFVFNGEALRIEMNEYPLRQVEGIRFFPEEVHSFGEAYYHRGDVVHQLRLKSLYHDRELPIIQPHARKPVKVPVTGPYTLAAWCSDSHYLPKRLETEPWDKALYHAREQLAWAFAEEVVRPNLEKLISQGAAWIQMDEPAATVVAGEMPIVVSAVNRAVEGLQDKAKFSIHICFGRDYNRLFPHLNGLLFRHICLELANREGYAILQRFQELNQESEQPWEVGIGVLRVHTNEVETAEQVKERILHAARFYDPGFLYACPDCGLRTRKDAEGLSIIHAKLSNMVEGARLAGATWKGRNI
ncbi:hypothetical protein HYS48_02515 [Candidatus Woesearchaeota archaeon]|nr:hypothetical protein [Candidatus Woesearchaeota archaeon]